VTAGTGGRGCCWPLWAVVDGVCVSDLTTPWRKKKGWLVYWVLCKDVTGGQAVRRINVSDAAPR
jgi:hypothetical protein